MSDKFIVREAKLEEYSVLGELMAKAYAGLKGFPKPEEIPEYYNLLRNVGEFTASPKVKLLVAISNEGKVEGGLVYFGDMRYYGTGGEITKKQIAGGFRLLAVNPEIRGKGLGHLLIEACFKQAKKEGFDYLVIHSTKYMSIAWKMYEKMGFIRFPEIDFEKSKVQVFGFRYAL